MKFILNSKSLLEKLQYLSGVLSTNSTMPILDCFLFKSIGSKMMITGSDLDNTISTSLDLDLNSSDNINIAIQGKLLIEILKTLSHQPLLFNVSENSTIEMVSDSGSYAIAYSQGVEFPETKEITTKGSITIQSKVLATAISKTVFATSNDDLRPAMTGVLFQMSPQGVNFVSTDAHRLVKYSRTDVLPTETIDFIVPRKPLNLLKNIAGSLETDITIDYNESNAKFSFDDYELTTRLIDAKYPQYERIIPVDNSKKLIVNRDLFMRSLKRVSLLSNKQTHQVKLDMAGTELNINTEDKDYSSKADERITCNYQGEDMQMGYNSRYLSEMLSNLSANDVQIEMSEPNRAGIITCMDGLDDGESILMLVMPVKL